MAKELVLIPKTKYELLLQRQEDNMHSADTKSSEDQTGQTIENNNGVKQSGDALQNADFSEKKKQRRLYVKQKNIDFKTPSFITKHPKRVKTVPPKPNEKQTKHDWIEYNL